MGEGFGASVLGVYCERGTDPAFWAEPINAVTNLAFLVAAFAMLRASRGDRAALALAVITFAIAFGSFAFHTLATYGAMLSDVLPITTFMTVYFYLAMRRFVGLQPGLAAIATAAFVGIASAVPSLFPHHEPWSGFGSYLGGLVALAGVAARLAVTPGPKREAGAALFGVAALFALSIAFRTVDGSVCAYVPTGTHALWHVINAVVLYRLVALLRAAPRI